MRICFCKDRYEMFPYCLARDAERFGGFFGRYTGRKQHGKPSSGALGVVALIGETHVNHCARVEEPVRAQAMSPDCRKRLLSRVLVSGVRFVPETQLVPVIEVSSESVRRAHGK